jgi:hypothetical protein
LQYSAEDQNKFCGPLTGDPHNLTIVIAADKIFNLNLAGHVIRGPRDNDPQTGPFAWASIQKYTRTVYGPGPFLISVDVANYGLASAMWSAVYLDGKLRDETGLPGSMWKMRQEEPSTIQWWTEPKFDDSNWFAANTSRCDDISSIWASMTSKWKDVAPDSRSKAIWYPNCHSAGTVSQYVHNYFRLLVDVPTPVLSTLPKEDILISYPELEVCREAPVAEDSYECDTPYRSSNFLSEEDDSCFEPDIAQDLFDCDVDYIPNTDPNRFNRNSSLSGNPSNISTITEEICNEKSYTEADFTCDNDDGSESRDDFGLFEPNVTSTFLWVTTTENAQTTLSSIILKSSSSEYITSAAQSLPSTTAQVEINSNKISETSSLSSISSAKSAGLHTLLGISSSQAILNGETSTAHLPTSATIENSQVASLNTNPSSQNIVIPTTLETPLSNTPSQPLTASTETWASITTQSGTNTMIVPQTLQALFTSRPAEMGTNTVIVTAPTTAGLQSQASSEVEVQAISSSTLGAQQGVGKTTAGSQPQATSEAQVQAVSASAVGAQQGAGYETASGAQTTTVYHSQASSEDEVQAVPASVVGTQQGTYSEAYSSFQSTAAAEYYALSVDSTHVQDAITSTRVSQLEGAPSRSSSSVDYLSTTLPSILQPVETSEEIYTSKETNTVSRVESSAMTDIPALSQASVPAIVSTAILRDEDVVIPTSTDADHPETLPTNDFGNAEPDFSSETVDSAIINETAFSDSQVSTIGSESSAYQRSRDTSDLYATDSFADYETPTKTSPAAFENVASEMTSVGTIFEPLETEYSSDSPEILTEQYDVKTDIQRATTTLNSYEDIGKQSTEEPSYSNEILAPSSTIPIQTSNVEPPQYVSQSNAVIVTEQSTNGEVLSSPSGEASTPSISTTDIEASSTINSIEGDTSATLITDTTSSNSTNGGSNNGQYTGAYVGGGAAALTAAAAAAFYFRRSPTAKAQVTTTFSDNTNMNPLYEGMQQFENPLYDGNNLDAPLDDGFDGAPSRDNGYQA